MANALRETESMSSRVGFDMDGFARDRSIQIAILEAILS